MYIRLSGPPRNIHLFYVIQFVQMKPSNMGFMYRSTSSLVAYATAERKCILYSLFEGERHGLPGVVKCGGHRYEDGTRYIGDWNHKGQKHGMGHLLLPDGTRYDGAFINGLCSGLGVMQFSDGSKYEGEFMQGWFHGHGIFWRADGMKFEGEFRGGRIWGLGLVTFNDHTHGFPRNEGFFQDCRMVRKKKCPEIVQRSQKIALMARAQCDQSGM